MLFLCTLGVLNLIGALLLGTFLSNEVLIM